MLGGILLNNGCKDGFLERKTTPTGIKQVYLYYITSFLIRFSHEREIVISFISQRLRFETLKLINISLMNFPVSIIKI
jgi:hypothetical protein